MRMNIRSRVVFLLLAICGVGLAAFGQDQAPMKLPTYLSGEELRILHADLPRYPPLALEARLEGDVSAKVSIDRGKVIDIRVISTANPVLSNAVLENIRTWEFGDYDSQVIEVLYTFSVSREERSSFRNPRIELDLPYRVKITGFPLKPTILH